MLNAPMLHCNPTEPVIFWKILLLIPYAVLIFLYSELYPTHIYEHMQPTCQPPGLNITQSLLLLPHLSHDRTLLPFPQITEVFTIAEFGHY